MNRTRPTAILLAALAALGSPAFAEEQAQPEGDGLAEAGKVYEVAGDGSATVVKGEGAAEPAPEPKKKADAISLADSCRLRMAAQCKAIQRCLGGGSGGMGLPCEAMGAVCDRLQGEASYTRKQLEACAKGLGALKCQNNLDPADPASFQLEARVPACEPVLAAEAAQGGGEGGQVRGPGDIDAKGAAELQRQLNEALGGH